MPKFRKSQAVLFRNWIHRINGESIYTTDGVIIYCHACKQQIPSSKFFLLNQHNQTTKHKVNYQTLLMEQGGTSNNLPIMDEHSKIIFLQLVLQHKDDLFGNYSGRATWEIKQKIWQQIFKECIESGCTGMVDAEHLRKTTWQNLQRRSKEKYDKSKKFGEGVIRFNKIDQLVFNILNITGHENDKNNVIEFHQMNQPDYMEEEGFYGGNIDLIPKEEPTSTPSSPLNQGTSLSSDIIINKQKTPQKTTIEFSNDFEELRKRKIYAEILKIEAETRLINAEAELKELEVEEKKRKLYNKN